MTDCSNVEVREQLPDLVSGMLSRANVELVESHLRTCEDCSQELEILRGIFAIRPSAKPVDVAAIVAALPRPSVNNRFSNKSRSSQWQRWRIAAAIATVAVGGVSWQLITNDSPAVAGSNIVASATDSALRLDTGVLLASKDLDQPVAVSFGGLGDYTDEELQLILEQLDKWDGAPSTEPLQSSSSPLIMTSGGSIR